MSTSKAVPKDTLLERKVALEAKAMVAEGFFLLYANLLSKDAHFHWDKIVPNQVRAAPWADLQGTQEAFLIHMQQKCMKGKWLF